MRMPVLSDQQSIIHHSGKSALYSACSILNSQVKVEFYLQPILASPAVLRYYLGTASLILAHVGPIIILGARISYLICRAQYKMKLWVPCSKDTKNFKTSTGKHQTKCMTL